MPARSTASNASTVGAGAGSAAGANNAVAQVHAPPRAPSPPNADDNGMPEEVRHYLARSRSPSSAASSVAPATRRYEPNSRSPSPVKTSRRVRPRRQESVSSGFTYGSGPIERSSQKYQSQSQGLSQSQGMSQSQAMSQGPIFETRTPGPARQGLFSQSQEDESQQSQSQSDKKRKREGTDELEPSRYGAQRPANGREYSRRVYDYSAREDSEAEMGRLQTGLTGGLSKLMDRDRLASQRMAEDSPLSPKKRARFDESVTSHDSDEYHRRSTRSSARRVADSRALVPTSREIVYARSSTSSSGKSHSEFFLSLVDKQHHSVKGQSIWGTLKSFHDDLRGDVDYDEYEDSGQHYREEKRLLRGLRMKLNRSGEVVLFALPDREGSASPG